MGYVEYPNDFNNIEVKYAEKEGYKPVPIVGKPGDEEIKIWRFLNFTQFVSILERKALFFTRVDNFRDPFEGLLPSASDGQLEKIYKQGKISKEVYEARSVCRQLYNALKSVTFVNCWHINEIESAVMWKPYLLNKSSLVIQSRFKDLTRAFDKCDLDVYIGKVQYLSYDSDAIKAGHLFQPFFCKRKSFEHENELRALIQEVPVEGGEELKPETIHPHNHDFNEGLYIPIALDLIKRIYLAPTTPDWLLDLSKSVAHTYGIESKKVTRSNLYEKPNIEKSKAEGNNLKNV